VAPDTASTGTAAVPNWDDLGLSPAMAQRARTLGWQVPTAVQVAAVPAVLQGRDLRAQAPTGSGKTGAFVLPLLQQVLGQVALVPVRQRPVRALVLAPTRELALQIRDVVRALAAPLKVVVAVGGVSINPQLMALRGGADLVIATPGRLLDLVDHNALRLSAVGLLVLDEADRLLDLGFAEELTRVLALLPAHRQTLLFSATWPAAVTALAAQALHDPLRVDAPAHDAPDVPAIQQRAIVVDTARRTALLRHLLAAEGWRRVLVFVATQHATEHVADKLRQAGVAAAALHGQMSQGRRQQVLTDLRSGALDVLVATDLAARGLDVAQLAVVVNHDLPRSVVDFTHRIGRTGRAGAQGLAVSFIAADAPASEAQFRLIEKRRQQRVPRETVAGFEPLPPAVAAALPDAGPGDAANVTADPNGGIKGRRKSRKDKLREAAAAAAARASR
jgi:ATP-dependent RNA helicase RhlE